MSRNPSTQAPENLWTWFDCLARRHEELVAAAPSVQPLLLWQTTHALVNECEHNRLRAPSGDTTRDRAEAAVRGGEWPICVQGQSDDETPVVIRVRHFATRRRSDLDTRVWTRPPFLIDHLACSLSEPWQVRHADAFADGADAHRHIGSRERPSADRDIIPPHQLETP